MKKKFVAIFMVFCILFSINPTSVFAAYDNTYVNTGNQIDDIIGVAMTQIGNTNGTKYDNPNNYAWCAYFIVWCARQAGIDNSVIMYSGYATSDDLLGTGRYHDKSTGYIPKRGDLIIYDWESDGFNNKEPRSFYGDHVGIVYDVDGTYVYTVEGNRTGEVRTVRTSLTNINIKGYGSPNYTTSGITPPSSPTGLSMVKASETTARLSWNSVANATSYEVQYYSTSSAEWRNDSDYTNNSATSYVTTGLGLYDSYRYRVRSKNSAGTSNWAEITYNKNLPSQPTNFKLTRASDTTATVSWNPVSSATSYEVEFWSVSWNSWRADYEYSNYLGTQTTSYVTNGLVNSSYEFRVRAKNNNGVSDWTYYTYYR